MPKTKRFVPQPKEEHLSDSSESPALSDVEEHSASEYVGSDDDVKEEDFDSETEEIPPPPATAPKNAKKLRTKSKAQAKAKTETPETPITIQLHASLTRKQMEVLTNIFPGGELEINQNNELISYVLHTSIAFDIFIDAVLSPLNSPNPFNAPDVTKKEVNRPKPAVKVKQPLKKRPTSTPKTPKPSPNSPTSSSMSKKKKAAVVKPKVKTSAAAGSGGKSGSGLDPRLRLAHACFRCREKKRKCDSVRPVCGACERVGGGCGYPEPSIYEKGPLVVFEVEENEEE